MSGTMVRKIPALTFGLTLSIWSNTRVDRIGGRK